MLAGEIFLVESICNRSEFAAYMGEIFIRVAAYCILNPPQRSGLGWAGAVVGI